MTVAATQRIMDIAKTLPDEAEAPVINFMFKFLPKDEPTDTSCRIGAAEGEFKAPEDFDAGQDEIYAEIERYALS